MNLEIVKLSEDSQRKTNITWYHLYAESKRGTDLVIYKTEVEKNLWLPGDGGKDKLGDLDSQHYCIYNR